MIVLGKPNLKVLLAALVVYAVVDGAWLKHAFKKNWYPAVDHNDQRKMIVGAAVGWAALAFGHSTQKSRLDSTLNEQMMFGAGIGLVAYGVYNGTEYAIRKDWTRTVALRDIAWGTGLSALVAAALYCCRDKLE